MSADEVRIFRGVYIAIEMWGQTDWTLPKHHHTVLPRFCTHDKIFRDSVILSDVFARGLQKIVIILLWYDVDWMALILICIVNESPAEPRVVCIDQ